MADTCAHGHDLAVVGVSHGHCNACRADTEKRRRDRLRAQGIRVPRGSRRTAPKRFAAAVDSMDDPDACWLWTGALDKCGYGKFAMEGFASAHRAAYILFVGPIPDGLEIDHLCRVRACVNPRHLEPVTHLENVRRGRHVRRDLAP